MDDSLKRIITLYDYKMSEALAGAKNPVFKGTFYPAQNKVVSYQPLVISHQSVITHNSPLITYDYPIDDVKVEVQPVGTTGPKLVTNLAFELVQKRHKTELPKVETSKLTNIAQPAAQISHTEWVKQNYANAKKGFSVAKVFVMLFLAVSMYGFATLAMPIIVAEASFRISQYTTQPKNMAGTASARIKALDPEIAQEFRIVIPKINLESRIIENVDATDEVAYKDALTKGIAQAKGSYLPSQGPVFLFAHSTNDLSNILAYNAKFYAVKDLNPGDQVVIFYRGRKYTYEVQSHQVINPSDLDTIRNSTADLIMSTCYPPGTDWQRLITFAKLVETSNR